MNDSKDESGFSGGDGTRLVISEQARLEAKPTQAESTLAAYEEALLQVAGLAEATGAAIVTRDELVTRALERHAEIVRERDTFHNNVRQALTVPLWWEDAAVVQQVNLLRREQQHLIGERSRLEGRVHELQQKLTIEQSERELQMRSQGRHLSEAEAKLKQAEALLKEARPKLRVYDDAVADAVNARAAVRAANVRLERMQEERDDAHRHLDSLRERLVDVLALSRATCSTHDDALVEHVRLLMDLRVCDHAQEDIEEWLVSKPEGGAVLRRAAARRLARRVRGVR